MRSDRVSRWPSIPRKLPNNPQNLQLFSLFFSKDIKNEKQWKIFEHENIYTKYFFLTQLNKTCYEHHILEIIYSSYMFKKSIVLKGTFPFSRGILKNFRGIVPIFSIITRESRGTAPFLELLFYFWKYRGFVLNIEQKSRKLCTFFQWKFRLLSHIYTFLQIWKLVINLNSINKYDLSISNLNVII